MVSKNRISVMVCHSCILWRKQIYALKPDAYFIVVLVVPMFIVIFTQSTVYTAIRIHAWFPFSSEDALFNVR